MIACDSIIEPVDSTCRDRADAQYNYDTTKKQSQNSKLLL